MSAGDGGRPGYTAAVQSPEVRSRAATLGATLVALTTCAAACGDDLAPEEPVIVRTDNGVARCGKPVVYLNFEGVTIFKGAVDDSRANVANVPEFPDSGMTIPAYPEPMVATRIRDLLYTRLAALRVPAVHKRPTSGDYFMLVFTDRFIQGVQSSRTATNCGYTNRNTIGFINTSFFSIHGGVDYVPHGALLVIGRATGMDPVASSLVGPSCMAADDFLSQCSFFEVEATLGPCTTGPQNQQALLAALACE